jgi:hypothetical protein
MGSYGFVYAGLHPTSVGFGIRFVYITMYAVCMRSYGLQSAGHGYRRKTPAESKRGKSGRVKDPSTRYRTYMWPINVPITMW